MAFSIKPTPGADDSGQPPPRRLSSAVGIVWGVRDGSGPLRLAIDSTPLAKTEPYGDFLTHLPGHYEVWEGWRRLGPAGLVRRGLPTIIAWHEYEHFPRGRVVFDTRSNCFTLYADRKLQVSGTLRRILRAFGIDPVICDVRSDPHYRTDGDWL